MSRGVLSILWTWHICPFTAISPRCGGAVISAGAGIKALHGQGSSSLRWGWGGEGEIVEHLCKPGLVQIIKFWIRFFTEKVKYISQKCAYILSKLVSPESVITHQESDTGAVPLRSVRTPPGAEKDRKVCTLLSVSLSSRDCLAPITGVLPQHLAEMDKFSEQLEVLSGKFWMRKN